MSAAIFPDLHGASVFITGGGSGIGAALTEGFLEQGAQVAFADIAESAAFTEAMAEKHGNRPLFLRCDITDTPALRAALDRAAAAHGPIAILVNNAANDERHRTEEVDETYWERMIAINLKACFFASQAVIPAMKARGGGVIVNLSSISYMMGMGDYPVYTTAKSGINGLTRSLARAHGADGIRVNALAPGWVLTERQMELWATEEGLAKFMDRMCLKKHLTPLDVVAPALFLASTASAAMTGQALVVDGGVVVTG